MELVSAAPAAMPAPTLMLYDTLEAALTALDLTLEDRRELRSAVAALGLPDPVLHEQVGVDRVSVEAAGRNPLRRTPPDRIPVDGRWAWFQAVTTQLPSGRVWQVQRRFPAHDELELALQPGGRLARPSVWLRELLLSSEAQRDPAAIAGFGLATIDDAPGPPRDDNLID